MRKSLAALVAAAVVAFAGLAQAALTVPPRVTQGGHASDPAVHAGFLDVTLYGADPTGVRDSTAAIQAAINDARDWLMTTYLPPGTYLISDTLTGSEDGSGKGGSFCYQVQGDNGAALGGEMVAAQAPTLVGPPSGARAVLKLADKSAGFGDPKNPKPAVHFVDLGPPSQYVNAVVGAFDCLMYSVIRDVDVDLGSGNAGAVGIQFYSAQFSYMANVSVRAGQGYAGIQGAPATSGWVNLSVDGGQYGILIDNAGTSSLAGISLSNQTVAALTTAGNGAITLSGFQITEPTGAAIAVAPFNGVPQLAGIALIDGVIEQKSGAQPVIANPSGINLFVRNVYVTSPAQIVVSAKQAPVTGSGATDLVAEYAYTDTAVTGGNYAPSTSYDMIDGVVAQKGLTDVKHGTAAPPTDLVLRHLPGPLPWYADPGVVDVTTFGADPTGHVDSTAALQKAIDASEGKGDAVFLPRGNYLVSGTLDLHPETHLFGVPGPKSTLWASTWDPKGQFAPYVRTADTASGKTFVGDIQFVLPNADNVSTTLGYAQSYLSALDWRAGRSSVLWQVSAQLTPDWGTQANSGSAARSILHVEKSGGGRFYGLQMAGAFDYARDNDPAFRFVFVDATTAPLTMYGPNLEHAESDDFVEVSHASNVRVFETKTECRSTWIAIESSKNVAVDGLGGDWSPSMTHVGVLASDSSNVELSILGWYGSEGSASATYVRSVGGGVADAGISYLDGVSLFQEGTFDDSAFPHCGDGVCDGAETSASCAADCNGGSSGTDAGGATGTGMGDADAGAGADVDAGAGAGAIPGGAGGSSGGCACTAAPAPDGGLALPGLAAIIALGMRRRRLSRYRASVSISACRNPAG